MLFIDNDAASLTGSPSRSPERLSFDHSMAFPSTGGTIRIICTRIFSKFSNGMNILGVSQYSNIRPSV